MSVDPPAVSPPAAPPSGSPPWLIFSIAAMQVIVTLITAYFAHAANTASGKAEEATTHIQAKADALGIGPNDGQKFCSVNTRLWAAFIPVPRTWERDDCRKFSEAHYGGGGYEIGCIFAHGQTQSGKDGQPFPDCGWGKP